MKKSISDGAIEPWAKTSTLYYAQTLASFANTMVSLLMKNGQNSQRK